jgi:hypothetical protein
MQHCITTGIEASTQHIYPNRVVKPPPTEEWNITSAELHLTIWNSKQVIIIYEKPESLVKNKGVMLTEPSFNQAKGLLPYDSFGINRTRTNTLNSKIILTRKTPYFLLQ